MNSLLYGRKQFDVREIVTSLCAGIADDEAWYLHANAAVPGGVISLRANAQTIFREPGFRSVHLGLHPQFDTKVWHDALRCFSVTAQRYQVAGAIDANVYVAHPETRNGLTVQIEPAVGWDMSPRQSNQIMSGRGAHAGHWRNGAKITQVPASALHFAQQTLDRLAIESRTDGDTLFATYKHRATTSYHHLLDVYTASVDGNRTVNLHLNLLDDLKKPLVYRTKASLALQWEGSESYFGISLGCLGNSSWDPDVPMILDEDLVFLNEVVSDLTWVKGDALDWKIRHACSGRDRGNAGATHCGYWSFVRAYLRSRL